MLRKDESVKMKVSFLSKTYVQILAFVFMTLLNVSPALAQEITRLQIESYLLSRVPADARFEIADMDYKVFSGSGTGRVSIVGNFRTLVPFFEESYD